MLISALFWALCDIQTWKPLFSMFLQQLYFIHTIQHNNTIYNGENRPESHQSNRPESQNFHSNKQHIKCQDKVKLFVASFST